MLEHTFIHIPGIGRQTEKALWSYGIHSWDDADLFEKRFGFVGGRLQDKLDQYIPRSREAIKHKNAAFFERLSTLGEAWRIYPEFADQCVYLDIETTGLSTVFDSLTMVGLYNGSEYKVFIQGQNLHELPLELKRYSVAVTFNGAGFDLRFLRLAFPDMTLPPIHIDLRWVTRRLGFVGGLKSVEERLKLTRKAAIRDLTGYDATVLWAQYQRGDASALQKLIEYNTDDVVHLKAIMEIVYDRLSRKTATFLPAAPIFVRLADLPKSDVTEWPKQHKAQQGSITTELLGKCSGARAPRVVGIDLTGSERRATGWALLDGTEAKTQLLRTDEELVAATIDAKPDLVSIDSPLSLPEGVIDPARMGHAPIYRKCELALKRMGISVFWCLLPTMKGLTMRGMALARTFRKAGLHVIESYPGAAQDLLGIPRKGASLSELKLGLHRAGINGSFVVGPVSHDEVDAVTSAFVGLFYLADDFIALGTPAEDYLIVPRSPRIKYERLTEILAVTGLDPVNSPIQ